MDLRKTIFPLLGVMILVLPVLSPQISYAQIPNIQKFNPTADLYIRGSRKINNSDLVVKSGAMSTESYLLFDLTPLAGKSLVTAKLTLKSSSYTGQGKITIFSSSYVDWTESNTDITKAPEKKDLLGSLDATYAIDQNYTWNLEPNLISVGGKFSLIIEQESIRDNIGFSSKEGSFSPELEVGVQSIFPSIIGRGYFTSVAEVKYAKQRGDEGNTTYNSRMASVVSFAGAPNDWPYGTISGAITAPASGMCSSPQDTSGPSFLKYNEGARLVYSKVLAYFFTNNEDYARIAREKILDLTDTTSYGGSIYNGANQCALELGFSLPIWIQSADLLEGSPVWSAADKTTFQNWLAGAPYEKVAWASKGRVNNWGSAGSTAAAMLADYVSNRTGLGLIEVSPVAKTLTPAQAYREHIDQQKNRMTGVFKGDSDCAIWGIQTHGGIPDELRRGGAGCTADSLQAVDNSLVYQITHTDFLLIMAEFLWHRGDTSLYDLVVGGKGSLKNAVYFVINNPRNASTIDWEAYRKNHLYPARRYYKDPVITQVAEESAVDTRGTFMPFTQITHPDSSTTPPVTAAPQ